jgi:hypothetical protein
MPTNLPPTIARFVQTSNARDVDAFVTCFATDAVVEDEDRTHNGLGEVRAWKQETQDRYRYTIEPNDLEQRDGRTLVTATLAGDFPGSPVDLVYEFTIVGDLIQGLRIHP